MMIVLFFVKKLKKSLLFKFYSMLWIVLWCGEYVGENENSKIT